MSNVYPTNLFLCQTITCTNYSYTGKTEVGRGIELWNRDTMMAYREDPFLDPSGDCIFQSVFHVC